MNRQPFGGSPDEPRPIFAEPPRPEVQWVEWSPEAQPHVKGRYTERVWDEAAKMFEEQRVEMHCTVCDARWKLGCSSGHVRDHIANFGRAHVHKDPLVDVPTVHRPGSLRRKPEDAEG